MGTARCPAPFHNCCSSQQICKDYFGCSDVSTNHLGHFHLHYQLGACTGREQFPSAYASLGMPRAAWDTGLCLLVGNADSSADVSISMKAVKYPLSPSVQAGFCLRLLVRSSSVSFRCFRPWFSTVHWQVGLNTLLVLHQGLFPPGYFPSDQSGRFKL